MKRAILFSFCAALCVLCPFLGATGVPWSVALDPFRSGGLDATVYQIFWDIRVPRVCLGLLCGSALAVGGLVFQGLFRNYLACPFTLGVSTGAAFGAAFYFWLGLSFVFLGVSGSSLFAFFGALITIFSVYALSAGLASSAMLLAGVVVSFFFSSLIVFLQYVSDFQGMFKIMRWLMGGFETVGWNSVTSIFPFVLLGLSIVRFLERDLDLLSLGDELAASRGTSVSRVRFALFLATSLMVGGVVSVCGPIGFVGIMVPHICRQLLGFGTRGLTVASAVLGGAFLALCDTVGRSVVPPYEIPVGVITALLGGPFFLWILLRARVSGLRQSW